MVIDLAHTKIVTRNTIDSNVYKIEIEGQASGSNPPFMIGANDNAAFKVNWDGSLHINGDTFKVDKDGNVTISKGSINLGSGNFVVDNEGNVTIKKGSITIGSHFSVTN
jgi:hypothetical protein